jgi:hypothetical protein
MLSYRAWQQEYGSDPKNRRLELHPQWTIANLLLARGASRRAQTSIRLALGASRSRLIRQSLTESIVLSVLGGLAGLIVAYLGVVQSPYVE